MSGELGAATARMRLFAEAWRETHGELISAGPAHHEASTLSVSDLLYLADVLDGEVAP